MINKPFFVIFSLIYLLSSCSDDSGNVITGCWIEITESSENSIPITEAIKVSIPITEVQFDNEGKFSVTSSPFEGFKSYWGDYQYNKFNQTISLIITGGNTIPALIDLNGSLIINRDKELILSDMYLGDFTGSIESIPNDIIYTFKNMPDFCVGR